MADVGDIANYAEIFGAIVVLGGLGFAILELRRAREQRQEQEEQRRRDAAFEIFRGMTSQQFIDGISLLADLPAGLSRAELEEQYGKHIGVLRWVLYQFENLGTMVYNGMVPIELAMEFYYVSIFNAWNKLGLYIKEIREASGKPNYFIYVQRLAEDIQKLDPESIGFAEDI